MKLRSITFLLFTSILSFLLVLNNADSPISTVQAQQWRLGTKCDQPESSLSEVQLNRLAQEITVKVFKGNTWGSGIIIQKTQDNYTVLTNAHVVNRRNQTYKIQTHDGKIYSVELLQVGSSSTQDLALLQFKSPNLPYQVACLNSELGSLSANEPVFAAGYPLEANQSLLNGFVFKPGNISWVLTKPLKGGYRVGYSIDIEQGMSGGPLLNQSGEVIGVNGKSNYPIGGYPSAYKYQDNSPPDVSEDIMLSSSWAIPIESLNPEISPSQPSIIASDPPPISTSPPAINDGVNPPNPQDILPKKVTPSPSVNQEPELGDKTSQNSTLNPLTVESGQDKLSRSDVSEPQVNQVKVDIIVINQNSESIQFDLEISRSNQLVNKEPISQDGQLIEPIRWDVIDLDADQEPEVILSYLLRKKNQCEDVLSYFWIYSYNPEIKKYISSSEIPIRGQSIPKIANINEDKLLELEGYDYQFSCKFTKEPNSQHLPLKIWQFRQGRLQDVTRQHSKQLSLYAKKLFDYYWNKKTDFENHPEDSQELLAAYLATKYLLNQADDGWKYVEQWYQAPDRNEYFEKLRKFLKTTGYTSNTVIQ